jgi:hypothetical protein
MAARGRLARFCSGETREEAPMRSVVWLSCLMLSFAWAQEAPAQIRSYSWADIDCGQSRIPAPAGLKCRATNVVTNEGNIGVFRQWAAFGNRPQGYEHIFLWEAQNGFSYLNVDQTTPEFLAWMYENGHFAKNFTTPNNYRGADYSLFQDGQRGWSCAGFRRLGQPQRGGYQSITGGILCAPPGKTLTGQQVTGFIDGVQLQ